MKLNNKFQANKDKIDKNKVDENKFDKNEFDKNMAKSHIIIGLITLVLQFVNGQISATNTIRLNRGKMLSVKRQSHV